MRGDETVGARSDDATTRTGETRAGRHVPVEEPRQGPVPVRVRFCGGCNPQIDRVAVADGIADAVGHGLPASAAVTVYVCGCQRACAAGHRLRITDGPAVVVAGQFVDARPTSPVDLTEAVLRALQQRATEPFARAPGGGTTGREPSKE